MENTIWYAVQENSSDDWGTGAYDKYEAINIMMNNSKYNLIAVIENDCCIEEIYKTNI